MPSSPAILHSVFAPRAELAAEFDDVAIGLELEDIDEEQQQNEEQH